MNLGSMGRGERGGQSVVSELHKREQRGKGGSKRTKQLEGPTGFPFARGPAGGGEGGGGGSGVTGGGGTRSEKSQGNGAFL